MAKCICCRIENAVTEVYKHPSITAAKTVERLTGDFLSKDLKVLETIKPCERHNSEEKVLDFMIRMLDKLREDVSIRMRSDSPFHIASRREEVEY